MPFQVLTNCVLASKAAFLNLFRVADHLTNFVSVRGPPKMSTFSEFLTTFLVIFPLNFFSVTFIFLGYIGGRMQNIGGRMHGPSPLPPQILGEPSPGPPKRIFQIFPISLHFSGSRTEKTFNFHLQASCDTIHKKVPSLVHTASSETSLKGGGVNFSSIFLYLQSQ